MNLFCQRILRYPLCGLFLLAALCSPRMATRGSASHETTAALNACAEADSCYVAALDMNRRGRAADAFRLFRQALSLNPSSHLLRAIVAEKFAESDRLDQALKTLKARDPHADLSSDERRLAAKIFMALGDTAATIRSMAGIADKEIGDYYTLGALYESEGKSEKALSCFFEVYNRGDSPLGMGMKIIQMEMALRHYAAADSLVGIIQAQNGDRPEFFNLHGLNALARSDTAGALAFFRKATAADSTFEDGSRNAAQIYLQRGNYDSAAACYESLRRLSPQHKDAYTRGLAIVYFYAKRYDKAAVLFEELLGKYINDPEIHYFLGCTDAALEKPDDAHFEFEKALALKPDYFDAWEHLYLLAIHEKDLDAALTVARRFSNQFPGYPGAWRLVGSVLNLRKEFRAAQVALLKAVALDSTDGAAWFDLGSCYERSNDIPLAAAAFKRVLRLQPGDPAASNYLGYMWADRGMMLDSAKHLLESALAHEPDNGAYLDSYGWILFKMGDTVRAFDYIIKACARIHNDPEVFEHLGSILEARRDFDGALHAFERCLEHNPDNESMIRQDILRLEALLHGNEKR